MLEVINRLVDLKYLQKVVTIVYISLNSILLMKLEEMYDPARNPQLAKMLGERGFPTGTSPQNIMRTNPDGLAGIAFGLEPGKNFTEGSSLFLVLCPNMGTGVIPHPEVVEERVTYLGPIFGDDKTELACKSQKGHSLERDISQDQVERYVPDRVFTPISRGIERAGFYHGFHNLNPNTPVALYIQRTFYRGTLEESV